MPVLKVLVVDHKLATVQAGSSGKCRVPAALDGGLGDHHHDHTKGESG